MVPFDQIKTLKFTIKTPFTLKRNNSYKKESSKKKYSRDVTDING